MKEERKLGVCKGRKRREKKIKRGIKRDGRCECSVRERVEIKSIGKKKR